MKKKIKKIKKYSRIDVEVLFLREKIEELKSVVSNLIERVYWLEAKLEKQD